MLDKKRSLEVEKGEDMFVMKLSDGCLFKSNRRSLCAALSLTDECRAASCYSFLCRTGETNIYEVNSP